MAETDASTFEDYIHHTTARVDSACVISQNASIGENAVIGPSVRFGNSIILEDYTIKDDSILDQSIVGKRIRAENTPCIAHRPSSNTKRLVYGLLSGDPIRPGFRKRKPINHSVIRNLNYEFDQCAGEVDERLLNVPNSAQLNRPAPDEPKRSIIADNEKNDSTNVNQQGLRLRRKPIRTRPGDLDVREDSCSIS